VALTSEFGKIREELDELRERIIVLEHEREVATSTSVRAFRAGEAADRQLAKSRSEWREVVKDLQAGMCQIISLLSTSDACLPARRPEKTQSASDKPLT
jgi:hypothetical protein